VQASVVHKRRQSQTTYSTATNLESLLVLVDLVLLSPLELLDRELDPELPDEPLLADDESREDESDPEPEALRGSFFALPVGAVVGVSSPTKRASLLVPEEVPLLSPLELLDRELPDEPLLDDDPPEDESREEDPEPEPEPDPLRVSLFAFDLVGAVVGDSPTKRASLLVDLVLESPLELLDLLLDPDEVPLLEDDESPEDEPEVDPEPEALRGSFLAFPVGAVVGVTA